MQRIRKILFQKLAPKLPPPLAVTEEMTNAAYQNLYEKVKESYQNKDFYTLSQYIMNSHMSSNLSDYKLTNQELLVKFISLCYEILTIYPIQSYMGQFSAALLLDELLKMDKIRDKPVLPWRPFYKIFKFFFYDDDLGQIPQTYPKGAKTFLILSKRLSWYFPLETNQELIKKFIPKISPKGNQNNISILLLSNLQNPKNYDYKPFLNIILTNIRDTTRKSSISINLKVFQRAIYFNINDDFSFLLPTLFKLIDMTLIENQLHGYPHFSGDEFNSVAKTSNGVAVDLAIIIVFLFLSDKSRKETLIYTSRLFKRFETVCHPFFGRSDISRFSSFINTIVLDLKRNLCEIRKKNSQLKCENPPTQEEIQELLSLICSSRILCMRTSSLDPSTIENLIIEMKLNPNSIDRYYQFAIQCSELVDVEFAAIQGYTILTALVMIIEKCESFQENFSLIVENALYNFNCVFLQPSISRFLFAIVNKISFNESSSIIKNVDFNRLAEIFFSHMISVIKSSGKLTYSISLLDHSFSIMLKSADKSLIQSLLPQITELIQDSEIESVCKEQISSLIMTYALFASDDQFNEIIATIKRQLSKFNSQKKTKFLLIVYSSILFSKGCNISEDEIKQKLEYLLTFTKNDDKKIRKYAWNSIALAIFSLTWRKHRDVLIFMKDDNNDPSNKYHKLGQLKDFQFEFRYSFRPMDSIYQIFEPILNEIMESNDPHEIYQILKEKGTALKTLFSSLIFSTKGSYDDIGPGYDTHLHIIPEFLRESVPIKEKFFQCAIRLLKEFPDKDHIITKIMDISEQLLPNGKLDFNLTFSDTSFSLFTILNPKIKKNDPLLNGTILQQLLERLILMRKMQFFTPLTPDISEFLTLVMNLTLSKNEIVCHQCTNFTISVWENYLPLYMKLCLNIVEHASTISNESFFKLLFNPCLLFSMSNNHVASKILFDLICKLEVDRSDLLTQLKSFLSALAFKVIPFDCPNNNDKNYINLLSEIEKMISQNNNYTNNRIFNISVIYIIYFVLKHVKDVSEGIYRFVLNNMIYLDPEIFPIALQITSNLLGRRQKYTKETIQVRDFPNAFQLHSVFKDVDLKLPSNGLYFPTCEEQNSTTINKKVNLRSNLVRKSRDSLFEPRVEQAITSLIEDEKSNSFVVDNDIHETEEEYAMKFEEELEKDLQDMENTLVSDEELEKELQELENEIDSCEELEKELHDQENENISDGEFTEELQDMENEKGLEPKNLHNKDINEKEQKNNTIEKIFESFEKTEILWRTEFQAEQFLGESNGYFMYMDHFTHRTYEFFDDAILLPKLISITTAAINGTMSESIEIISYRPLFYQAALCVGPRLIPILKDMMLKFLSGSLNDVITSILSNILFAVAAAFHYWPLEDRISFFKSVFLPSSFILISNPNERDEFDQVISTAVNLSNPLNISPLLKALLQFVPSGPNSSLFSRGALSIISSTIYRCNFYFINSIDDILDKLVLPFFNDLESCVNSEYGESICIYVSLLNGCCLNNKNSPLYSPELVSKREKMVQILEDFFENKVGKVGSDPIRDKTLKNATVCLLSYLNSMAYDTMTVIIPIIIKHLRTILFLMNTSDSLTEEQFFIEFTIIQELPIFGTQPKLLLDFTSAIFKDFGILSQPMQLDILNSLYEMIECNLLNIPTSDSSIYEELILNFASEQTIDEIIYRAAALYGIFYTCHHDDDYIPLNIENDGIDEIISQLDTKKRNIYQFKSISILVTSFMYDKVNPRVIQAFEVLESIERRSRTRKTDFYKKLMEIFRNSYTGMVLPSVEEVLNQYQSLVHPDYIC